LAAAVQFFGSEFLTNVRISGRNDRAGPHRTLVVIYKWRESGDLQLSDIFDNEYLTKECAHLAAFAEMTALRNRSHKESRFFSDIFCILASTVA